MTLPNTCPPAPPIPIPMAALPPDAAVLVDPHESRPRADYNLRPLVVGSLDHYVERDTEDERFHVS